MNMAQIKLIARAVVEKCIRNNTDLEDLHSGITPSSKKDDYSDVYVVSPYGQIEWKKLSRISDEEMRSLMLSIEENLIGMLGFLFIAVEKGKVNIMGRDFTMKDMVEKYKKTYKKGVSWDKKGHGGF